MVTPKVKNRVIIFFYSTTTVLVLENVTPLEFVTEYLDVGDGIAISRRK